MSNNFIDIITNYKLTIDANIYEYIILLDYEDYLQDIHKAFVDIEDRFNQYHMDFNRSNIYLNNVKYLNSTELLCNFTDIKNVNLITLICNQAVFGLPYQILSQYVNDNELKNNIYLGEVSINDKRKYKYSRVHINIECDEINNVSKIVCKKLLRLFTITKESNDVTISLIFIKIVFDIENEDIYLTYKIKNVNKLI